MTDHRFEWINDIASNLGVIFPDARERHEVTREDVAVAESFIGGEIGDDVVYFLSRYGDAMLGDDTASVVYRIDKRIAGSDAICPDAFLSFRADGAHSILSISRSARTPKGLLPIAIDASANLICIDISRSDGSVVYYHRSATASPWAVTAVAPSFRDFLSGLQKDPYQ